jgi:amidophosphoribosyltransferase
MDQGTVYAARDPQGIRPLVLGRLERGWVVASETAALDIVGASYIREIEPASWSRSTSTACVRAASPSPSPRAACSSSSTSPARHPDQRPAASTASGSRSAAAWPELTRRRRPRDPGPESGTPAAIGYAEASGIPYGQGLVKNSYVGRTFIQPSQTIRQLGIR